MAIRPRSTNMTRPFLFLFGLTVLLFNIASIAVTIALADALYQNHNEIFPIAISAAVISLVDLLWLFVLLMANLDYTFFSSTKRPKSTAQIFIYVMLSLVVTTASASLTLTTLICTQLKSDELGNTFLGDSLLHYVDAGYAFCITSLILEAAFLVILAYQRHKVSDLEQRPGAITEQIKFIAGGERGADSTRRPKSYSVPAGARSATSITEPVVVAKIPTRSSGAGAVNPRDRISNLLAPTGGRDALLDGKHGRPRNLSPIPGSRPSSVYKPLDNKLGPSNKQGGNERLLQVPPRTRSVRAMSHPSPVSPDESHIHPLFRSSNALPLPERTPSTSVVGSAMNGLYMPTANLYRTRSYSRPSTQGSSLSSYSRPDSFSRGGSRRTSMADSYTGIVRAHSAEALRGYTHRHSLSTPYLPPMPTRTPERSHKRVSSQTHRALGVAPSTPFGTPMVRESKSADNLL